MTNSESLLQFGNNAYGKPATALNVLRETVMGRELFDYAFREYARRWKFRRPMPSDFFRTMEDASAVDLDWFWRGWFYTTDHVDIGISEVRAYGLERGDPEVDKPRQQEERDGTPKSLSELRDQSIPKLVDADKELLDFYNEYDELDVTDRDRETAAEASACLDADEAELLKTNKHFVAVEFENIGGLVMPLILDIEFESGQHKEVRIRAEVWRRNPKRVTKLLISDEPIVALSLDPHFETADTDRSNNAWPARAEKTRFQLYKESKQTNPMQDAGLGKPEAPCPAPDTTKCVP